MANISIYVPVYMVGANGKKAYQFAELTAQVTTNQVPEGEVCLNSRYMTVTPPARIQPPDTG